MKMPAKWMLCLALCSAISPVLGQYGYDWLTPTSDTNRTSRAMEKTHSQNFCSSKDLVGANVKDSQGNKLGDIPEILINPKTGETFATIGVEGGRHALLPVQALNVTRSGGAFRNAEVTLNATKESLQSGPTVARNEWQQLDSPTFVQSIYRHYNVQQPSAMGGSGPDSGSMSGQSTGDEPKESEKQKTKE